MSLTITINVGNRLFNFNSFDDAVGFCEYLIKATPVEMHFNESDRKKPLEKLLYAEKGDLFSMQVDINPVSIIAAESNEH